MTVYDVEIDGTDRDFITCKLDETIDRDPSTWQALLKDATEVVSKGDAVNIQRDLTTIFSGVLEVTEEKYGAGGAFLFVAGRHVKVKLWRKWCERYSDSEGFWTSYYPNKIVAFLLRPSFSEYDPDNHYTE